MLDSGSMIGKYQVVRMLGKGGMGVVYLGWDNDLKREVAIKTMNPKAEGVENALSRFRAEARAIARLSNINIVQVYDFAPEASQPYIVMEFIRGQSLTALIRDKAPLEIALTANCARQALEGLAAAHNAGIIHRDIKPANILLSDENIIKLMDFGLARSLDIESGLTASGVVVGTLHYLAPEVARGDPATRQSDLYSLGITLYEMLTGTVPFDDESPLRLIGMIARETPPPVFDKRPDLPPAMAAWLHKLIAGDPAHRYDTAAHALEDLVKSLPAQFTQVSSLAMTGEENETVTTRMQVANHSDSQNPSCKTADISGDLEQGDEICRDIDASSVDAIMAEAIKIEKAGRDLLDQDALLEIADEVGVSAHAVRQAIVARKQAAQKRVRMIKQTKIGLTVAVCAMLLSVCLWLWLRHPPHEERDYNGSGNSSAAIQPGAKVLTKAGILPLTTSWVSTGVMIDGHERVLLVRIVKGKRIAFRVGSGREHELSADYYGPCDCTGEVFLRSLSGTAAAGVVAAKRLRMAALPFCASRQDDEAGNLAAGTGDAVLTRLAQSGCFELVERVQVDRVIANVKLENTKFFDPATTVQVGRMLGVDYLISGSVQKAGDRYRLSARRMQAGTGKVLENVVVDGTDIFALQDKLADELRRKIAATEVRMFIDDK